MEENVDVICRNITTDWNKGLKECRKASESFKKALRGTKQIVSFCEKHGSDVTGIKEQLKVLNDAISLLDVIGNIKHKM